MPTVRPWGIKYFINKNDICERLNLFNMQSLMTGRTHVLFCIVTDWPKVSVVMWPCIKPLNVSLNFGMKNTPTRAKNVLDPADKDPADK